MCVCVCVCVCIECVLWSPCCLYVCVSLLGFLCFKRSVTTDTSLCGVAVRRLCVCPPTLAHGHTYTHTTLPTHTHTHTHTHMQALPQSSCRGLRVEQALKRGNAHKANTTPRTG